MSKSKLASPYIRFSKARRPEHQVEHRHLNFGEIIKLVGAEWRSLDAKEKDKYIAEFRKEQQAFDRKVARQKSKEKAKKKTKNKKQTDDNFNLVDYQSNGYGVPSAEEMTTNGYGIPSTGEPTSTLERYFRWMPPAPGAFPGAHVALPGAHGALPGADNQIYIDPSQHQFSLPYAPGAFGQEQSTAFELSQQYITYPPPVAPISPPPDVHPVMINSGAPVPAPQDNECVILSESRTAEPSNQNNGPVPVPTGIFVSEYYKELTGASSEGASSEPNGEH